MFEFFLIFNFVLGWGKIGHMMTGTLAEELLTFEAKLWLQTYIGNRSLPDATYWADTVKWRYPKTKKMHYIDSKFITSEEPGCELNMKRDCADGVCIVTAIQMYYDILNDNQESLLFLIHFMGDIHQPLHNIDRYRGGNDYKIKFGAKNTNMHTLWDSIMLETIVKQYHNSSIDIYTKYLKNLVKKEFVYCPDKSADICPEYWSLETGRLNCKSVWVGVDHTTDLKLEYFEKNRHVFETQLLIAGYRLGVLINRLARGDSFHEELK